jgi:hypothetical protein
VLHINKKGIHPGAHIALDLVIFGGVFTSCWVDPLELSGIDDYPYSVGVVNGIVAYVYISWILHIQPEL